MRLWVSSVQSFTNNSDGTLPMNFFFGWPIVLQHGPISDSKVNPLINPTNTFVVLYKVWIACPLCMLTACSSCSYSRKVVVVVPGKCLVWYVGGKRVQHQCFTCVLCTSRCVCLWVHHTWYIIPLTWSSYACYSCMSFEHDLFACGGLVKSWRGVT